MILILDLQVAQLANPVCSRGIRVATSLSMIAHGALLYSLAPLQSLGTRAARLLMSEDEYHGPKACV